MHMYCGVEKTNCAPGEFLRAKIIQDDMNRRFTWELAIHQIYEFEELLFAMTVVALTDHPSGGHVVGGGESNDAMAVVVVALAFRASRSHRQDRLSAFQSLGLTLSSTHSTIAFSGGSR